MRYQKCALLCLFLVLSTLGPLAQARRNFGRGASHSYPKSGGLSGGGSHGYPSSGGLSGSGGHRYPPSGGLSGGGGHGYPSSGGLSGGGRGSSGSHSYPSSGGLSGGGSSNTHHTNTHGYPANKGVAGTTNHVHHHYNYNPPQQIRYTPVHGGAPQSYPVYHGNPPTYVYKYKDSGSKYGTLLAGLALLNLGTAAAGTAYLASKSYKPQPGEVCYFAVKKENGDYEETKIDCNLISSFILIEEEKAKNGTAIGATNGTTTITTTTVTNLTTINGVSDAPAASPENATVNLPLYQMLPNGTLVPINTTDTNTNTTETPAPAVNGTSSVIVTTTVTNTTVTNALEVKGKEVQVTPGMQCFFRRESPTHKMRKAVPCGLLQTYAEKSLKKNSAYRNGPALTILSIVIVAYNVLV